MANSEPLYDVALRQDEWDLVCLVLSRTWNIADPEGPTKNSVDHLGRLYLRDGLSAIMDTIRANVPKSEAKANG